MADPVQYHLGKFPPDNLDWGRLVPFIGKANGALARYDGLLSAIPNKEILMSPLTTQEAVLSSKIEGTHVTMSEVLEAEAVAQPDKFTPQQRNDIWEVVNYRSALNMCANELKEKPLTQHLIRQAHAMLMDGVRGRDKLPGGYRTDQNWIGAAGCTIEHAGFVPIAPEHLASGMDAWSNYLSSGKEKDLLVQLAVAHVEFEALHPFMDGNGRLGRMLIPLFLYKQELLSSPNFYMSAYFEKNREAYQEQLRNVSRENAWTEWCIFFLEGIIIQANENKKKAQEILNLYEKTHEQVPDLIRTPYAAKAVEFIFKSPIFQISAFVEGTNISMPTAKRIIYALRDGGVLYSLQRGAGKRSGVFVFSNLLNTAEGRTVF